MVNFIDPVICKIIKDPWFFESRLEFKDITGAPAEGIRFHNVLKALFLRLFGKIIDIRDVTGHLYHLNRNDVIEFLIANRIDNRHDEKQLRSLSEAVIRKLIDEIGKAKSDKRSTLRAYSDQLRYYGIKE